MKIVESNVEERDIMLIIIFIVAVILLVVLYIKNKGNNQQTLKEALADKITEKYMPKEDDSLFVTFYSKLMEQAYANFKLDGFEYLYIVVLLEEIKNDEDDLECLTDFYQSNRLYDFNDFNIKSDQKRLFSHEDGVAERVQLYITIQPYLKYREKLINIKESDIDILYEKNQQSFEKVKAIYDDSKKRNMNDFISKSITVMNTIRLENKVFSYAKDILHP